MDLIGGVDFRKGCYVGQEVVSRVQHRGTARRRILRLELSAPAEPGTPVMAGDTEIGTLGSSAGTKALASIRTDKWADAKEASTPVTIAGMAAQILAL
jgi:folate-binding Fe-S cluster repair protein YgfZ